MIFFRKRSLKGEQILNQTDIKKVKVHQFDNKIVEHGGLIWIDGIY